MAFLNQIIIDNNYIDYNLLTISVEKKMNEKAVKLMGHNLNLNNYRNVPF